MTSWTEPSGGRIDAIFASLREQGRTALMPFITAGDPSLELTGRILTALSESGASIVELGIPFSDPIADGPVIAASMHRALEAGTTPQGVFDLVRAVRAQLDLGLVAMVSDSILQRMGPEQFVLNASAAGVDGLIVPDIDLDAARDLIEVIDRCHLSFSLLIAPTTAPSRVAQLASLCRGFVYLLARTGITGEQDRIPPIEERVAAIRGVTDLPIAVGFGVSRPEQVAAVTRSADAAIVGSALVRRIDNARDPVQAAGRFVMDLAGGLQRRTAAGR